VSGAPALTFPTDYPIKVVGKPDDAFRARLHAVVLRHAPDLTAERVRERPSANGNFVSITYLVPAVSAAQIEALVTELRACEGVVMLL
jgi:uncharacterized protein